MKQGNIINSINKEATKLDIFVNKYIVPYRFSSNKIETYIYEEKEN
jgi:hypothetical protein